MYIKLSHLFIIYILDILLYLIISSSYLFDQLKWQDESVQSFLSAQHFSCFPFEPFLVYLMKITMLFEE